jgi:hypothetical protein
MGYKWQCIANDKPSFGFDTDFSSDGAVYYSAIPSYELAVRNNVNLLEFVSKESGNTDSLATSMRCNTLNFSFADAEELKIQVTGNAQISGSCQNGCVASAGINDFGPSVYGRGASYSQSLTDVTIKKISADRYIIYDSINQQVLNKYDQISISVNSKIAGSGGASSFIRIEKITLEKSKDAVITELIEKIRLLEGSSLSEKDELLQRIGLLESERLKLLTEMQNDNVVEAPELGFFGKIWRSILNFLGL